MSMMSPTSGTTDPWSDPATMMQMLFGQQQGGVGDPASMYGQQQNPWQSGGATTPNLMANRPRTTGSDAPMNPFSSKLGSNIVQNPNGSVGLSGTPPATSQVSNTQQAQSFDPSSMFSSFQQMIAPYLQQLQGISQNAQQSNNQIQSSLNNNLQNTAQTATPSSRMDQGQANQDILQAVTGAVNGIGGGESYGAYWSNIQNQLKGMGFTDDMMSALQPRFAAGSALGGNITDAGGGNSNAFITNDSGSLDSFLNKFYSTPQPSASPAPGVTQPPAQAQSTMPVAQTNNMANPFNARFGGGTRAAGV